MQAPLVAVQLAEQAHSGKYRGSLCWLKDFTTNNCAEVQQPEKRKKGWEGYAVFSRYFHAEKALWYIDPWGVLLATTRPIEITLEQFVNIENLSSTTVILCRR